MSSLFFTSQLKDTQSDRLKQLLHFTDFSSRIFFSMPPFLLETNYLWPLSGTIATSLCS